MSDPRATDDGLAFGDAACTLADEQRRRRADWVRENVLGSYRDIEELESGYALTFEATEEAVAALARLAYMESGCCSQGVFELELAPPFGEVTLTVTGPEGTKRLVRRGWIEEFDVVSDPA